MALPLFGSLLILVLIVVGALAVGVVVAIIAASRRRSAPLAVNPDSRSLSPR